MLNLHSTRLAINSFFQKSVKLQRSQCCLVEQGLCHFPILSEDIAKNNQSSLNNIKRIQTIQDKNFHSDHMAQFPCSLLESKGPYRLIDLLISEGLFPESQFRTISFLSMILSLLVARINQRIW